jgi:beta-glucosidase-like glycosyl hydrolase/CubicO group peptidase (beta-lactamase class C family)
MKRFPILLGVTAVALMSFGGRTPLVTERRENPAFLNGPMPWADSVLQSLNTEERIAQLMMVAAWSNKGREHVREIEDLVRQRNIGGLIFFQGGPVRQAKLTNHYQKLARTPLLVGMDLEWGLAMRLDSTMRFPKQMTLGALESDEQIEAMGGEIARQMKRLGVQVSFSPVADVNNNPANPVINDRSFGEERELVARKSIAYMRGLQNGGVIATAKHFPGHGDTDTDSHLGLPLIAQTRARLDSLELYPFERMVAEGLSAVMVGHLEVPALDSIKGMPSTLSHNVVSDLLEKELGFKGLIFTDALNMKGVANADKPGEIELRALLAGNDVLLFPQDPVKAIDRIMQAVDSGIVPREMIDHKCLKLLRAKEWAGLSRLRPVVVANIADELNLPAAKWLRRSLYQNAITVLRNEQVLPIRRTDSLRIASLAIGDTAHGVFQQYLGRYARISEFRCDKVMNADSAEVLLNKLKGYDLVIASVHGTTFRADKEFGVPQVTLDFLRRVGDQQRTVFALFANPYRLMQAYGAQRLSGLVVAYEENDDTQDLVAQLIFGAIPAKGHLPVTASSFFKAGDGLAIDQVDRLTYTHPEADGVLTADLKRIDDIVQDAIAKQAFPGCEVLVARGGDVLWNKAYGRTSYGGRRVRTDDIYDLASVTKVVGTTLAVMKLTEQGRIDLDKDLGTYLPELAATHPVHGRVQLRDLLTHQAGMVAFVPYFRSLVRTGSLRADVFADTVDHVHTVRVAEGVYMKPAFQDSLWAAMLAAPVAPRGNYLYSDLDFHLLARVVERVSGKTLDTYLDSTFYRPLGLATMGYRPWQRFPKDRIIPTEDDHDFRMRLIQGDVHDQGAAMLGGVAGHAGLFSNANDLAVIMRMLLNGGTYAGVRYLNDSTIADFTKCQFCKPNALPAPNGKDNRRGLGWDKPQPAGKPGPACECVSYLSFGHTGFTGTQIWADPADSTIYVFLSNRINPSAENKKLSELNIRTRIQEVVHDAVAARPRPILKPRR